VRPTRFLLAVAVTGGLASQAGGQQPSAPAKKSWVQGITLNGFAEASYSYNFNRPASGLNQLRVFDFDDNKVKLDNAELVVQRAVASSNDLGFRVDAVVGQSVPKMSAAAGLFRDASGKAGDFDLQQIFVSYIAPIGKGLRIDAGKFLTHIANEVIPGYDGYNEEATRSMLFGYGAPGSHTGAKATYAFSPKWSAMLEVCEGWDVWKDNNSSLSFSGQVAVTPADNVALYFNAMTGPERSGNDDDNRTIGNIIATWKLSSVSSVALDALVGHEQNAAGPGIDASWSSVVLYGHRALSARFALNARGEVFDDADGTRTGAAQRVVSFTLTPEMTLTPHFVVRSDLRLDHSNVSVFEKDAGLTASQSTILVSAIFKF